MTGLIYLDIILIGVADFVLIGTIFWSLRYKLIPLFILFKAIYDLRAEKIDFKKEFLSLGTSFIEGSCTAILILDRHKKFVYASPTMTVLITKKDILKFQHSDFFINDTNARHIKKSKTIQIKLAHGAIKEILFKALSRQHSQNFNYFLEKIKGTNNSYRANLSSHFQKMGTPSDTLNDEISKQQTIDDLKQHLGKTCALNSLPDLSQAELRKKRDRAIREAGKWLLQSLNISKFDKGHFEHIIAPAIYDFFGKEHFPAHEMGYTLGTIIKQISIIIGENRK
ncbi:hypothetical protein [Terasakiella pusilla]|uniref:hypothetical protein n=1 Tax=Terasakiella pusilla TaxID=64973 RepID=UPI003AA81648